MKICPNCGKACEDRYIFCDGCGYAFDMQQPRQPDPGARPVQNGDGAASQPSAGQPVGQNGAQNGAQGGASGTGFSQPQHPPFSGPFNYGVPTGSAGPSYGGPANPGPYDQNAGNPPPRSNPFAVASLVLGIIGVVFLCCYLTGIVPGILATVFGFVARSKIALSRGRETGSGYATAGLVLGLVTIGLFVIGVILGIIFSADIFTYLNNYEAGSYRI